jgi:alginate O-acetyltransferase complex protein AlgI
MVFYGWWDYRYCALLLLTTTSTTSPGGGSPPRTIRRSRNAGCFSVCSDLSILGFFKYYDLGADTINQLAQWVGAGSGLVPLLHLVLPVGISFYTFQAMSYSIDIYRGHAKPARSFIDFACYVSLFPQLVAGPIVRYHELDNQLRQRSHTWAKAGAGIVLFVLGLSKKVLLADAVAPMADWGFAQAARVSGRLEQPAGLYAPDLFRFQRLFRHGRRPGPDARVPVPAELPFALQIRLHDRILAALAHLAVVVAAGLPLHSAGRKPKGAGHPHLCELVLTMLLGGLWHGASWTFMLWGGYHGTWLAVERMNGKRGVAWRLPRPMQVAVTFVLVMFGWMLFRAPTLEGVARMVRGLTGMERVGRAFPLGDAGALNWGAWLFCTLLVFASKNTWEIRWKPGGGWRWAWPCSSCCAWRCSWSTRAPRSCIFNFEAIWTRDGPS